MVHTRGLVAQRALICLTVLLSGIILYEAKAFFAPVITAFVFAVVLSPLTNLWERLGLSQAASSFLTVTLAFIFFTGLATLLEPYVSEVIKSGPMIWNELRSAIEGIRSMIKGIDELAQDVTEAVASADATSGDGETAGIPQPSMPVPTFVDALLYAPQFASQVLIFVGTLYFFLLTRTEVYDYIGTAFRRLSQSDLFRAERRVSRYFLTISAINGCFGLIVTVVMTLYGMPAPLFWGAMAFLLNFVLYLGPIALAAALMITGLVTFDGLYSVLPALTYLAMNATEGQFVTPSLVGKSLSINPLLVFLSLVFWLWLWGPIGGIIAIPTLIWTISIMQSVSKAS